MCVVAAGGELLQAGVVLDGDEEGGFLPSKISQNPTVTTEVNSQVREYVQMVPLALCLSNY